MITLYVKQARGTNIINVQKDPSFRAIPDTIKPSKTDWMVFTRLVIAVCSVELGVKFSSRFIKAVCKASSVD